MSQVTKPVDESIEDPIASIRRRMDERGMKVVRDLSDEERETLFERLDAKDFVEQRRAELQRKLDGVVPKIYRANIELLPAVEEWIEDFSHGEDTLGEKPGLALVGLPGTGKTHTAWQILRILLGRGYTFSFEVHDASLLFEELQRCAQSRTSDKALLDRLGSVDLLVIDDLAAKPLTEFREDKLRQLLDRRSQSVRRTILPTIITTNVPRQKWGADPNRPADEPAHLGHRNADRIEGTCRYVLFPFVSHRSGRDYSGGPKK